MDADVQHFHFKERQGFAFLVNPSTGQIHNLLQHVLGLPLGSQLDIPKRPTWEVLLTHHSWICLMWRRSLLTSEAEPRRPAEEAHASNFDLLLLVSTHSSSQVTSSYSS